MQFKYSPDQYELQQDVLIVIHIQMDVQMNRTYLIMELYSPCYCR